MKAFAIGLVVLAAGRGQRLAPLTDATPKPLMYVGAESVLTSWVRRAREARFDGVVVTAHHLAPRIVDAVEDGSYVRVMTQPVLNGPAGGFVEVADQLGWDVAVVVHGDIHTWIDLADLVEKHETSGAVASVVGVSVPDASGFGALSMRGGTFVAIRAKGVVRGPAIVNSGIYVFSRPAMLSSIAPNASSLDFDGLLESLVAGELPVGVLHHAEPWCDIGTVDTLLDANARFLASEGLSRVAIELCPNLWFAGGVHPTLSRHPHGIRALSRSLIFASSTIAEGVTLSASVVGPDSVIERNVTLERCVILPGARIADGEVLVGEVRGP